MKEVLDSALTRLPGAMGLAVVGPDGLPVAMTTGDPSVNMEWAAAEGMDLVRRAMRGSAQGLQEAPEEVSIAGASRLTIFRSLGAGYFLCLVAGPAAMAGQARFEAWRTGERLREVLG